ARVPALALSGLGESRDIRASQDSGFFAPLIKPVPWEELRAHLLMAVEASRHGASGERALNKHPPRPVPGHAANGTAATYGSAVPKGSAAAGGGAKTDAGPTLLETG